MSVELIHQLSQRDLEGDLHDPTILPQEIAKMPEVEEIMNYEWGSFDQLIIVREHLREDGKVIHKGVGVSVAFMPGVTPKMREDIIKNTVGIEGDLGTQRWDGVKQGQIFCMSKDLEGTPDLGLLIRRFIGVSGLVIDKDHLFRDHERVERFLSVQGDRLNFASIVAEDAQRILDTPKFTGWSSMDERYKGAGKAYLIEFYEEDGVVFGSCPDGSMRPVEELAIDDPHREWIKNGLIPMIRNYTEIPGGYRIGGDGEDTETVSGCGNEGKEDYGSCSDFFKLMENGLTDSSSSFEVNISSLSKAGVKTFSSSGGYIKIVDTLGRMHTLCSTCKNNKEKCSCRSEDEKESENKKPN